MDELPWLVHGFGSKWSHSFGSCGNLATLKQIHSGTCVCAEGRCGVLGEGDALLENKPGQLVGVKTADCVPILLADDRNRAVAAVHAGWRGTVQRIAVLAIQAMRERYGTRAADLHAAIGPGIGACCFEVGPEVASQFGLVGRAHVNLEAENCRQLEQAGVPPDRVHAAHLCTVCNEEFWSFRRERHAAGRMLSVVGVK